MYSLEGAYLEWIAGKIMPSIYKRRNYSNLIDLLHSFVFRYKLPMDENRMLDGIDLRYRFAYENGYSNDEVNSIGYRNSCSVLEMMAALAIKGDERILYDYETGEKADFIFMSMLKSLELDGMVNDVFDNERVSSVIEDMLDREYCPNGRGGLFTVDSPRKDMRDVDIWYQMNWYIQQILE